MSAHNEKMSIYNGMASVMSVNLINNYLPIFSMAILSASNYQVGLINSLPPLISLLMTIPVALILNRLHQKKKIIGYSMLITRSLILLLFFIGAIPLHLQAWAFLAVIALMNIPGTMVIIGWQAFIGELIAEKRRGQFFSKRNQLLTIIGMISMLTIGIIMRKHTHDASAYHWLFFISFCFGLIETYFFFRHKEPRIRMEKKIEKKLMDWSIFQNREYRWFLITALWFNFAWQMPWGLFNIYIVKHAHASILWISLFSVGNQFIQILTFSLWKKWADKYGNLYLLIWISIGMAIAPISMIVSTNLTYLLITQAFSGFFVSGTILLLFNALLERSPKEKQTYCITTYNVLLSAVAFIAPQIGIFLLEYLGMNVSMEINTLLRLISAGLFYFVYKKYSAKVNQPSFT